MFTQNMVFQVVEFVMLLTFRCFASNNDNNINDKAFYGRVLKQV